MSCRFWCHTGLVHLAHNNTCTLPLTLNHEAEIMFVTLIYQYITISWVSFTFTSAGILLGHFLRGMSNTPAHTALPKCNSRKKVSLDRRLLKYIPLSKDTFRKSFRRHSILQPTFYSSLPNQLILPKQHLTPSCDRGIMLAPQAKGLSFFWRTKRACQPQQQGRKKSLSLSKQ